MDKEYKKPVELDDKWQKRIETCCIRLYGYVPEYTTEVYNYREATTKELSVKFSALLTRAYDTQLKLTRIYLASLYSATRKLVVETLGVTEKQYIEGCMWSLISSYQHRYIPELKLLIISAK